ncbi:MAG: prephenate dehydrogenase [Bacteroidota bacterium]
MNVYIIGIGLIGGSMSLDIQVAYPEATIYGIDVNDAHLEEALQRQLIHKKATLENIQNADIVIVTIPVHASIGIITEVLEKIHDNALVIDAGSTKEKICQSIASHPKRRNFLAAHPIAGTEFSGPAAAVKRLFDGKTNIICEVEKTAFSLQEKALQLFKDLGMRIRYMDPKSHDKHIAYVSHLSHISSFMLGKTVIEKEKNERDIFDLAGSGFASTVRLAKSSPAMWTPIFEQNKANVIETLDEYISNLQEFKSLMLQDNFEGIYKEMENTNHIKKILKGLEG